MSKVYVRMNMKDKNDANDVVRYQVYNYLICGMISKCESSISFFSVHEETSYETESIWPKIVTSAMTVIVKKLTLVHL